MNHPDVAVSIWRVMQISEFQMHQTGADGYETNDSDGTSGMIDVAYRGQNEVVVLCNGVYHSPLLAQVDQGQRRLARPGQLSSAEPNGKTYATHAARLFVLFPSQTIDTVARIMSPVSNAIIDQNFREVSLFLHMMSTAMERQPGWVENVSSRLEGVLAERRHAVDGSHRRRVCRREPGPACTCRAESESRTAGDEGDRGIASVPRGRLTARSPLPPVPTSRRGPCENSVGRADSGREALLELPWRWPAPHIALFWSLRSTGIVGPGKSRSVLEFGEQNWFGDLDPSELCQLLDQLDLSDGISRRAAG